MSHERLEFTPYEIQRAIALKRAVDALIQCEKGEGWLYLERPGGGVVQIKLVKKGVENCVMDLWRDLERVGLGDLANRIIAKATNEGGS